MAQIVSDQDRDAANYHLVQMQAKAIPAESIYPDLLAPVALVLGRMCEAGMWGSTQVSIGLCKLQAAMRQKRLDRLITQPIDGLGVTLARDERIDQGWAEIASVRRAAWDQGIAIVVGSPGCAANPQVSSAVERMARRSMAHRSLLGWPAW